MRPKLNSQLEICFFCKLIYELVLNRSLINICITFSDNRLPYLHHLLKVLLHFLLLFENYNSIVITIYLNEYTKWFVFLNEVMLNDLELEEPWHHIRTCKLQLASVCTGVEQRHIQALVLLFWAFILIIIWSNANTCNTNVILCGLDSVKMLRHKQCYTKYRYMHRNKAWKYLFWSH